jgi:hypothetical protein
LRLLEWGCLIINNDRYCLNGQRLIAISGVDGQSGSKYRTEINSFSKIKYNGNYWTVKTKSGQTFEYGIFVGEIN